MTVAARKDAGRTLQFPTTLVKQYLDIPESPEFDIKISFNSQANWYFSDEFKMPSNNIGQQYDFERFKY